MADITPFNFGIFSVRVITRDNQPWFVANDICNALGYSNTSKAIGDHLDEDERMTIPASDGQNFDSNQSLESFGNGLTSGYTAGNRGGARHLVIINESGLYALVLRSRKPEARKFAKWVTSEVLPSIRKTGSYADKAQEQTSRIDLARQLAHAATAQVYQAVFDAVLKDGEPPHFTRLLLGFTGSSQELRPHVQALESGSIAMTLPQLAKAIRTDLIVPDTTLANLAAACTHRMAERAECQARRAASQNLCMQDSLQLR